jgi:hypothetical protein
MEICKPNSEMSMEEVVIGNTAYVVKTNAKNVSPEFVKKTVKKILFGTLKQKSQKIYGQTLPAML